MLFRSTGRSLAGQRCGKGPHLHPRMQGEGRGPTRVVERASAPRTELRRGGDGDRGDSAPERPDLSQSSDGGRGAGVLSGDPQRRGRPCARRSRRPARPSLPPHRGSNSLKITQAQEGREEPPPSPRGAGEACRSRAQREPSRPRGAEEAEEAEEAGAPGCRAPRGSTPCPSSAFSSYCQGRKTKSHRRASQE